MRLATLSTLAVLLVSSAPALADDEADAELAAQQKALEDAFTNAITKPVRGHRAAPFTWNLGAEARTAGQHTDTETTGGLALAAYGDVEVAYEYGVWSSYAATGGAVRAQSEPGLEPFGLDHWAAVRPWQAGVFTFEVDHQLTIEGRPQLSRRPDLWRRSFTSEHIGVEMTGLHWRGTHWGVHFMRVAEGFDFTWQNDEERRFGTTSDWSFFGLIRDPADGNEVAVAELMSLEAEAIDGDRQAAVINTMYFRFVNVPLGPLPVRIDGAIGDGGTGYTTLSSGDDSITIVTEDLPLVSGIPVWRARIHGAAEGVEASAGASRSLFLTYDINLALEERASASLAFPVGDGRVQLEGFAARTELWTDETTSYTERTGGGSVSYERPLRDGWVIELSGQAARSFYADLDSDRAPTVGEASRFEIGLRKELGGSRDLREQ
jgi:hypothetical protein